MRWEQGHLQCIWNYHSTDSFLPVKGHPLFPGWRRYPEPRQHLLHQPEIYKSNRQNPSMQWIVFTAVMASFRQEKLFASWTIGPSVIIVRDPLGKDIDGSRRTHWTRPLLKKREFEVGALRSDDLRRVGLNKGRNALADARSILEKVGGWRTCKCSRPFYWQIPRPFVMPVPVPRQRKLTLQ